MFSKSEKLNFLDSLQYKEICHVLTDKYIDAFDLSYYKFTFSVFYPVHVDNVSRLKGVKIKNCFLWNSFGDFNVEIQNEIKSIIYMSGGFIYDLEREEYILDFAAEKV